MLYGSIQILNRKNFVLNEMYGGIEGGSHNPVIKTAFIDTFTDSFIV